MADKRLGVGFVGSGFNARFHLQGLQAVRDVDVLGVWSPNLKHADDMAAQARRLDLGPAKAHRSIAEMVADPGVDALWLCGPNQARVENVEEIVDAMTRGKGTLKGVACEKPLARNVAEAVRVTEMVKKAGLAHGGRAQRAPHAVVLARGPAGGRRLERHDVPLVARGASPPHQARRAALDGAAGAGDGSYRQPEMEPAGLREAAAAAHGQGGGLHQAALGRFRERDDRIRHRRRRHRAGRGHHLVELRGRGAASLRRAARPRVLDVVELAREPAQAVLQSRGERSIRRRPGRKAERGDGAHARHLGRGGGVRLRGRGPALRARVPRARSAAADVRRRPRGGEAPDDRIHERRAGEDVGIPPQGAGDIRAGRRERNVETMRQMRNAECGMRNRDASVARAANLHCNSAFRIPHSAFLLVAALLPATVSAQQWPVHSMDRPRPPVVDPGPERPPVPPPADAIVLFDGKDLGAWQSQDSTPAKWVVRNGYVEVAPHTGVIMTKRGFGDMQLHVEWAAPTPPGGESQERGNSGVFLMGHYEIQVLDSYHNDTYADGQAAAVYGQMPPLVNACRPPGQWQTYDIV